MTTTQVRLLTSLAKNIKTEQKDRKTAIATLQSARILTKSENFTSNFSNLNKVVVNKK